MTDIYGQKLGADQTQSFDVGPAAAYVQFRDTGQKILEAQFPPKVAVEMQNVDLREASVSRLAHQPVRPRRRRSDDGNRHGRIARNVRHFEIFDLLPFLNDAGKGAAYLVLELQGAVLRERHAGGGEGRPRRPGHRHRRVAQRRLQFDPRRWPAPWPPARPSRTRW